MGKKNFFLVAFGGLIALVSFAFVASPSQSILAVGESSSDSVVSSTSSEPISESAPSYATIVSKIGYTNEGSFAQDSARGVVDLSAETGDIGDRITFTVYGNPSFETNGTKVTVFQYKCTAVWVNTTEVTASASDNIYSFDIVDGTTSYIVTAYFNEQDNVKVTDLSTINWSSLLTVDNLIKLIYFALTLLLSSGFFITLLKSKKIQSATTNQITSMVTNVLNEKTTETFDNFFNKTLTPLLTQYNIKFADMSSTMNTLLKCFTLSQENTPQARLAIAEELEKLTTNDAATTSKVIEIVNKAISDNQAQATANKAAIEAAKEANANLTKTISNDTAEEKSDPIKPLPTE